MKILVTGGAGFIGSHVVDGYVREGHEVLVVDDLSTGKTENLNSSAPFRELSILSSEFQDLVADFRPDVINHHAAQIAVPVSIDDPVNDARRNVLGSVAVFEAARRFGVSKVINVSSGGAMYGEPVELPCDEDHPVVPESPYGMSKYAAELYLDLYHRLYGVEFTSLRYGNVYGPRQDPHGEAGVVAIFTERMLQGLPCTIFGDGTQERDFIYVGDIVRANIMALERASGRAINIGTGAPTTVNEVFRAIAGAADYDQDAIHEPARAGEVYRIYLDVRRAEAELGWTPSISFVDGVERTVRSFTDNDDPA
ncbi:MAG: NAD-dependent epimerase/dehydratase family protein [Thermomicrobiales bacterium]